MKKDVALSAHILLLEDEESIADPLIYSLQAEGFQVTWWRLVADALTHYRQADLLILDVGLPDGNGFELCKKIRRDSEVPVIFLTARASEIDRVVGLEIGADDYVVKPFSPRELVARIKTILKRSQRQSLPADLSDTIGDFTQRPAQVQILCQHQVLALTALEYRLLSHFLAHPHQVLSREQLLQCCGVATDIGYDRNIDTHIKSLRAKFRQITATEYIITQRGFGYRFNPTGSGE